MSKTRSYDAAFKFQAISCAEPNTNWGVARDFRVDQRRLRNWRQNMLEMEKMLLSKKRHSCIVIAGACTIIAKVFDWWNTVDTAAPCMPTYTVVWRPPDVNMNSTQLHHLIKQPPSLDITPTQQTWWDSSWVILNIC